MSLLGVGGLVEIPAILKINLQLVQMDCPMNVFHVCFFFFVLFFQEKKMAQQFLSYTG